MKFLIFASLFVVSAFAEPESESDARYLGTHFRQFYHSNDAVPYKTYNNYAVYPYSYHPQMFSSSPFNAGNQFYRRVVKREAEADAEPNADAQFYYRPGVYNSRVNMPYTSAIYQSHGRTYASPYTAYTPYTAYNTPYTGFNDGYQNYQQRPYGYFF